MAEYLVGNLDEKGYLACSIEEAAYDCSVEEHEVEIVLSALQSLEPPGIGRAKPPGVPADPVGLPGGAGSDPALRAGRSSAPTSTSWENTSSARSPRI